MIFWIASYPKSGNTWVRSMISSYYYSNNGVFNQKLLSKIGQFPQEKYFKDYEYDKTKVGDNSRFWIKAQEKINKDKELKFFKTHNFLGGINGNQFTNRKNTIAGIYIVRDPRNILTSLKNHYEINNEDALNFMTNEKKFIYDVKKNNDYSDFQFISSWHQNYKSWIYQKSFPIKVVKYEDLEEKTFYIFKDLITFIDKIIGNKNKFDKKKAINCIKSSSFDKLKNIEKTEGFRESILSKDEVKKISFFHLGPKNNWKRIFDENYQKKLTSKFEVSLKELDYI